MVMPSRASVFGTIAPPSPLRILSGKWYHRASILLGQLYSLPGSHDVAENRTWCCPLGSVTFIGVALCMVEGKHLGRFAMMQVPAIIVENKEQ